MIICNLSHMRKRLYMLTYQGWLYVNILARAFIYTPTSCVQAAEAQASLRICADSPEPSLLDNLW